MSRRSLTAAFLLLPLAACGRSATGPTPAAPGPSPAPVSVHPVAGFTFYDEDGDGALDAGEDVRLAGVQVTLGPQAAPSGGDGRFALPAVPAGPWTAGVSTPTLPGFFVPSRVPAVQVPAPAGFELAVPLTLPIGRNRPHVYLAFGDSLTQGDGSRGRRGYRDGLARALRDHWGRAEVVNDGQSATRSGDGADRIAASLGAATPAYTLIMYGTNDWNSFACRRVWSCFTVPSLRSIVRQTRAAGSLPVVATLPPVNPAYVDRLAEDRNGMVVEINLQLRPMVREEGGVVAEVHAEMMEEAGADLEGLFSDHVHPNDRGYEAITRAFFRAITEPRSAARP
jgi:lysophospholipase L1-like esterase